MRQFHLKNAHHNGRFCLGGRRHRCQGEQAFHITSGRAVHCEGKDCPGLTEVSSEFLVRGALYRLFRNAHIRKKFKLR